MASEQTVSTPVSPFNDLIEMVIFLRDRTGIHFNLEDGHLAQADELLDMVIEEQGLPIISKHIFALWIVSDLLDLRMKRSHNPYHVVQKWDELCACYTDAKFEDIVKSEPVLMVQRDVFYTLEEEKSITNEQILCLLYHEAKVNVIEGRYVLHNEDYHRLAGIQALLHLGKYNPRQNVAADYRSLMIQFYPQHLYEKTKFLFFTSKSEEKVECEDLLMNAHKQITEEFGDRDIDDHVCELYSKYLDICRSYPYYGSAFFSGQIERPVNRFKKLMNIGSDIKCTIGINTECISVIDIEKHECVLTVPFTQLSWRYREAQFDVDDDSMPCLFLQFLYDCPINGKCTKLLEVYSNEGKLMDALISCCVKRKLESGVEPVSPVDDVDSTLVKETSGRIVHKLDKMVCSTYTLKGDKLDG